mgnify:CR=1 FL=1
MPQQRPLAGGADALQLIEHGAGHRLIAAIPMVFDGETVGLVAHSLEQLRGQRVEPRFRDVALDRDQRGNALGQLDRAEQLAAQGAPDRSQLRLYGQALGLALGAVFELRDPP